ncbi:MAG: hypothetical protein JSU67_09335 [Gammaproteobacteria bacterium]|nr:MAG: hypothetical protein EP300_14220 [Gammaproteobacteria bacterium]UCH41845.1 MAG: hypothetical protein JSU67_09335 [Gammaproteobacteria bacterium]
MQSYRYLAATTAVSNAIDSLPQTRHKLPYGVVADWMEEHEIEAEDILQVSGSEVRALVAALIERDQPTIPNAA